MTLFFLQSCDGAGQVTTDRTVEARDVYAALVQANRRLIALARAKPGADNLPARIDVTDQQGRTVARLLWSEVLAATG